MFIFCSRALFLDFILDLVLRYLLHTEASKFRRVIAETVLKDQDTYNQVFLGKPPHEYAAWIMVLFNVLKTCKFFIKKDDSWGGAIEVSILAAYCHTELAVCDVQSCRMDIFGQAFGFTDRTYLVTIIIACEILNYKDI